MTTYTKKRTTFGELVHVVSNGPISFEWFASKRATATIKYNDSIVARQDLRGYKLDQQREDAEVRVGAFDLDAVLEQRRRELHSRVQRKRAELAAAEKALAALDAVAAQLAK